MNFLKKLLAAIVMILAALGFVICLVGVVAAWAFNDPATQSATAALTAVEQYSTLGSQTVALVGGSVGDVRAALGEVDRMIGDASGGDRSQFVATMDQRLNDAVLPRLKAARDAVQTAERTAVNINQTLESVNRIPGINVPTFGDELQVARARLQDVDAAVEAVRAAAADVNFDGARLQATALEAVNRLSATQAVLDAAHTRLEAVSAAAAATAAQVPGWIDAISLIAALSFVLFGAGQIFLFKAGLEWFNS